MLGEDVETSALEDTNRLRARRVHELTASVVKCELGAVAGSAMKAEERVDAYVRNVEDIGKFKKLWNAVNVEGLKSDVATPGRRRGGAEPRDALRRIDGRVRDERVTSRAHAG